MEDNKYSRRKFISKQLVAGSLLFGGLAFGLGGTIKALAKGRAKTNGIDPDQTHPKTAKKSAAPAQNSPKAKKPEAVSPCDDMTGVDPAELEKRKKMAYVTKAPVPDKHCGVCALYIKPPAGTTCGKCMLFKGPVRAEGACAYWAPIANPE